MNIFLMILISYFKCYESILFDLFYLGLQDRSAADTELSRKAPQVFTSSTATSLISQLLHLPMLHLTSAKIKNSNISSTLLLSPGKCLDRDLITENAKSCF